MNPDRYRERNRESIAKKRQGWIGISIANQSQKEQ